MSEKKPSSSKPDSDNAKKSSVLYISHLPKSFVESGMREYFNQFGNVVRVKHCRSKKTANSKGYGFVWFSNKSVAEVAASAMNNYLVFNKLMKCRVLNRDEVPMKLLKAKGNFTASRWSKIQTSRQNRQKSAEKVEALKNRMLKNLAKKDKKLAALGINYSFLPGDVSALSESKPELHLEAKEDPMEAEPNDCSLAPSTASMFIDSSEDEVTFATPKNVVKRTKKQKELLRKLAVPAVSTKGQKPRTRNSL